MFADHKLWTIEDAAAYLRISPSTLRDWIKTKRSPPYVKLGHSKQAKIRFIATVVMNWAASLAIDLAPRRARGRPRKASQ